MLATLVSRAGRSLRSALVPGDCRTLGSRGSGAASAHTALLTFGNGSQGALGTGRHDNEYEPEEVDICEPVVGTGAGHYHSFAITDGGGLWSWGRCSEHQLGRSSRQEASTSDAAPGRVEGLQSVQVTQATGSGVASFAVSSEGDLFAWGSSKRGQLGLGTAHAESPHPCRVPGLQRVVQVSAGWGHALAIDEDGGVYSWGFPQHGRLGHSFAGSQFEKVGALEGVRVRQIACGMDFSLALDWEGNVFAFGDGSLGQLGRSGGGMSHHPGDWIVRGAEGQPLTAEKVAAGLGHCLAVGKNGVLYSWGWNSASQLGLGQSKKAEVILVPSAVDGVPLHPKACISAGRVHSLLVTDDPVSDDTGDNRAGGGGLGQECLLVQPYAWGSGLHGRLGIGSQQDATYPELIADLDGAEVVASVCGFDHSLILIQL